MFQRARSAQPQRPQPRASARPPRGSVRKPLAAVPEEQEPAFPRAQAGAESSPAEEPSLGYLTADDEGSPARAPRGGGAGASPAPSGASSSGLPHKPASAREKRVRQTEFVRQLGLTEDDAAEHGRVMDSREMAAEASRRAAEVTGYSSSALTMMTNERLAKEPSQRLLANRLAPGMNVLGRLNGKEAGTNASPGKANRREEMEKKLDIAAQAHRCTLRRSRLNKGSSQ